MQAATALRRQSIGVLLLSSLVVASCAIIYELIIGATSSYLQGDSVYQFSITIGLYLSGMGIGSWLSKYIERDLLIKFMVAEVVIAAVGGFSALGLFTVFAYDAGYSLAAWSWTVVIGALVGLELPLLTRIIHEQQITVREAIGNALSFDYLGSLLGSLAFPLFLLPRLGLIRTSLLVGIINLLVVFLTLWHFRTRLTGAGRWLWPLSMLIGLALGVGLYEAPDVTAYLEQQLYRDPIVHADQSAYQRIVLTRDGNDLRLYLNGGLQFSSRDEFRYHEALVHPAMSLAARRERILVLGGGDGLALRELFKYPEVKKATLVDLDRKVVDLARTHPDLVKLNGGALDEPRLKIINMDAYRFLEESDPGDLYDVIIIDLPDPNNESLNKLYSREFYRLVGQRLAPWGFAVTQSTSPQFAPKVYWSIRRTVEAAGLAADGYHLAIPSFGDWGFTIAAKEPFTPEDIRITVPTRHLTDEVARGMFTFGKDMLAPETAVNTLVNPVILNYYAKSWVEW